MDQEQHDRLCGLWRAIGEMKALANPDGLIAKGFGEPPEQRLQLIWEILQRLEP